MGPYSHLFRQEQPYVSHQNPQEVLILVAAQWYSNCYMIPELANNYSWRQVGTMPVSLMKYQKSKVFPVFMYIQHRKMVCGKLHICNDLVLYKNPLAPRGFGCETQNGNAGNWLVSQYNFTSLCETSELPRTRYSLSIHFLLLYLLLYFPW